MHMLEHSFEPEAEVRRIEVITGTGRRRRWSVDDKARIIAETLAPGVSVSEVARRYGMSPQQIFGWRREVKRRSGEGASCAPIFAPVVLETPVAPAPPAGGTVIEIIVGSLVARVPLGADGATLARVAQALKAAS